MSEKVNRLLFNKIKEYIGEPMIVNIKGELLYTKILLVTDRNNIILENGIEILFDNIRFESVCIYPADDVRDMLIKSSTMKKIDL